MTRQAGDLDGATVQGGSVQQRIGILGGTFNPIHYGHLAAAEEVGARLHLDRVLFVPSYIPPHKAEEEIPSAADRKTMVTLAIAGNPRFSLSEIEIARKGRSYTIDTIEQLRSLAPGSDIFFLTGVDAFLEIRTWHQWERLLELCAFVVLSRPGYRFSDLLTIDFVRKAEHDILALDRGEVRQVEIAGSGSKVHLYLERISHYEISSTDIRKRVRQGLSIKYLLPEPVEHYIITNELYA